MGLQNRELSNNIKSACAREAESVKRSEDGLSKGQENVLDKKTK